MKSPQGREAKKPKKSKSKTPPKTFENPARNPFQVPKSGDDSGTPTP
ncbi:MAG TPA: hypothetical protein VII60_00875 [Acidimicrobiales bacterium]